MPVPICLEFTTHWPLKRLGCMHTPIRKHAIHANAMQPLTLPEYRKMDLSKLPLKEQRRYWKLLNRQVRACVRMGMHAWPVDAYLHTTRRFFFNLT